MELRDYRLALQRHRRAWVGLTLAGLLAALLAVQFTPPTYRATAAVFVGSTLEGTSGSQFINQRVQSYPDIAVSQAVLGPVADRLGLESPVRDLRSTVSAENPVDTSQIDITVTAPSAELAAEVANAVADRFGTVVEELEAPAGNRSPVELTVTDPAIPPVAPASPDALLWLALGLVVGLSLGLALAIVRSRLDTRLHTEEDVRRAWGEDDADLVVHAPRVPAGVTTPEALLARQLELLAEEAPRTVALVPAAGDVDAGLPTAVAAELAGRGVPTGLQGPAVSAGGAGSRVLLHAASRPVALRDWRAVQRTFDGIVLVVPSEGVAAADLAELRSVVTAAGIRPLSLVLVRGRHGRRVTGGRFSPFRRGSAAAPTTAVRRPLVPATAEPAGLARRLPTR